MGSCVAVSLSAQFLAARAKMSAALADHDAANKRAARGAGLAGPVVRSKMVLHSAASVDPVDAGAVMADAAAQRLPDAAPQRAHLGGGERVAAPQRVQPGQ